MLEFLQTGKALSVLAAIGMIGFVSKLITRSLYKRLLKETDNMAMTRNKNLQNLKQRLENTCRLGQNIVNTQAYLDKQIDGFSFLHISLDAWNGVSMEMVLLGLLTGAAEAFLLVDLLPICTGISSPPATAMYARLPLVIPAKFMESPLCTKTA